MKIHLKARRLYGVKHAREPHILFREQALLKKCHFSGKKHLQVSVTLRRYPFTGGAEMHQRGARRAEAEMQTQRDARIKTEIDEAERAES